MQAEKLPVAEPEGDSGPDVGFALLLQEGCGQFISYQDVGVAC